MNRTGASTKLHSMVLAGAVALAACGQQETPPATPATVAEARQLAAQAEAAPATPAAEPVNTCAMLSKDDAQAVLGALMSGPDADPPQGSLLGQCRYMGEKGLLMVSARPAHEFKGTVAYSSKSGGARTLSDLPGEATLTKHGVMIQPPGKPYFVVVFVVAGEHGFDEAITLAAAGKLDLKGRTP